MFNIGDKVIVKTHNKLHKEGYLKPAENLEGVWYNKDTNFVVLEDFNFYGHSCVIEHIDEKDQIIPYFLSIGIWVPEFMIQRKQEPPIKDKKENNDHDKIDPFGAGADLAEDFVEGENIGDQKQKKEGVIPKKVWVNNFNNKPFGKLFVKLINIDEKIAEFSATSFSKLKKHELQYIAELLIDNGAEKIDYNKMLAKDLGVYCYHQTLKL